MAQLGRISGGVLKDNLLRNGANLNFKNEQGDTALLHLNVGPAQIGVNTESTIGDNALTVAGQLGSTTLLSNYLDIANLYIDESKIENLSNNIFLTSSDYIFATNIQTDDLSFDFNTISSTTENTNIELRPDGSGNLNIRSNWNITGNLFATGDITFGGNLTFGDSDTDNVNFEAELASDIIPNNTDERSIGRQGKRFQSLYTNLVNGKIIEVDSVTVSDTSLALRQGNIFYVSINGDDSHTGDHQHDPVRTLKHALSIADSSVQGPVTIYIFPGEYEEEFPLYVPPHVTIKGVDLRNVIIKPTVATQDQDAFLIEGDVTIEDITVKDFYYNSLTNTGHAFRFKPNGVVSTRSPYIRNITVITKGSVISASDPRGFNSGDAGKGALVDGSDLDGDSLEASMLFHSVTFITPGVDALTMTNGVRVEWLNSFTYFANRGLYATQGTEGKTMPDSTTRFGAEIRSIGSACVYGNFGAVADGPNTLMYLIGHNFAYIGTGKDVSNDSTLVIQNNETVEINFGKIYYNSTDALGTYRIGNQFFVDFESGETSIDANSVSFSGVSSIFVNKGGQVTYIDGERFETGNIRIQGNTIENIAEDLEISPYTEILDLTSNPGLVVSKGTDLERTIFASNFRYNTEINQYEGYSTANTSFGGIYSDDKQTSIDATNFSNEIILRTEGSEIGRIVNSSLQIHGLYNEDILFDNNTITTTLSNSDLELVRDGTAVVNFYNLDANDSYITNKSDNPFVISTTARGYAKFDSTTGVVLPYGTTAERPSNPEIGDTRWNVDTLVLETYNGEAWQRSAGEGEEVTEDVLKELVDIYTIVLG